MDAAWQGTGPTVWLAYLDNEPDEDGNGGDGITVVGVFSSRAEAVAAVGSARLDIQYEEMPLDREHMLY